MYHKKNWVSTSNTNKCIHTYVFVKSSKPCPTCGHAVESYIDRVRNSSNSETYVDAYGYDEVYKAYPLNDVEEHHRLFPDEEVAVVTVSTHDDLYEDAKDCTLFIYV